MLFICTICCSAASRLEHVCDWSSAAATNPDTWMCSCKNMEILSWFTDVITTFMWLLSCIVFVGFNEAKLWKEIQGWLCFEAFGENQSEHDNPENKNTRQDHEIKLTDFVYHVSLLLLTRNRWQLLALQVSLDLPSNNLSFYLCPFYILWKKQNNNNKKPVFKRSRGSIPPHPSVC